MRRVSSVEPSSMTIACQCGWVCASSESSVSAIVAAALRAGMITDTAIGSGGGPSPPKIRLSLCQLGIYDVIDCGIHADRAVAHPYRARAHFPHRLEIVRDEDQRTAIAIEAAQAVEAAIAEGLVADRQHLIEQQDIGRDADRHCERQ